MVVDFLTYKVDRLKLMPKFIEQMIKDPDMDKALAMYGYRDVDHFKEKYERYRKTRY